MKLSAFRGASRLAIALKPLVSHTIMDYSGMKKGSINLFVNRKRKGVQLKLKLLVKGKFTSHRNAHLNKSIL
jgi:hypothetical protein